MRERKADAVIIGGGASGLAAAIELGMKAPSLDILVIEKNTMPGRKLKATGSGRCNIANVKAEGYDRIKEFFKEIGLVTKAYENGLVYPHSESAADVVRLLTARARSLGVRFACGEEVTEVRAGDSGSGFHPHDNARLITVSVCRDAGGEHRICTFADHVILACGGKAGPSYGTTGDGIRIARALGHSIVTPVPALTGVECVEWNESSRPCAAGLAGTRHSGIVRLYKHGVDKDPCFAEKGEVQFTRYGLSGICVFNMTRHMRLDRSAGESLGDLTVMIDMFPDGNIREFIGEAKTGSFSGMKPCELLVTILKEPIAAYVIDAATELLSEDFPKCPVSLLDEAGISVIEKLVHAIEFHPKGIRGWKDAQVTMGGFSLDEIDAATSASKLVPGLYITGELADRDYECGGFNLSNAWITGVAAADDIAAETVR